MAVQPAVRSPTDPSLTAIMIDTAMFLFRRLFVLLALSVIITGCESIGSVFDGEETAKEPRQCPYVGIVDDTRNIILFKGHPDMNNFNDETHIIAAAAMTDFNGGCTYDGAGVEVELNLDFIAQLGPAARAQPTDPVKTVFPYFIAITDPSGNIIAKHTFDLSLSFDGYEKNAKKTEELRQYIPLNGTYNAGRYQVFAGFQLTKEQFDFNLAQKKNASPVLYNNNAGSQ